MENLPQRIDNPGTGKCHIAGTFGTFMYESLGKYDDFYFFSPDETTSNRMEQVYDTDNRAWVREIKAWDKNLAPNGHIIEMLSENTLFATLAGHILSGGRGAMTSYEAFLPIITSQLDQHLKFLKQAKEVEWRPDYQPLHILATSCWERQDHNGYTHQNPGFISSALNNTAGLVNCFFPVDDVAATAMWEKMEQSRNVVNIATFNKNPQPRWIDINHARYQMNNGGASIFGFASDDAPWVVVAGCGDLMTREAIEGINLAKELYGDLKVRLVNIAVLTHDAIGTTDNKLSQEQFDELFGSWPVVINFHGYADTMRTIISNYADTRRFRIHGYEDEGSTTTPLDELSRNRCSRWDIAADLLSICDRSELADQILDKKFKNAEYAKIYGIDE